MGDSLHELHGQPFLFAMVTFRLLYIAAQHGHGVGVAAMSVLVVSLVAVVYGGSALIAGGAGVAWLMSHSFRKSMIGEPGSF
jgi:Na+/serine symporter